MSFNTTSGELFLVELSSPYERLEIQFVPESINQPREGNFADISIVGRNHDLQHYVGGKDSMTLSLEFLASEESRSDVIRKVAWLQSLIYNDGFYGKVRNIKVVWGDLFTHHVWTVRAVSPTYRNFDSDHGWLPLRAIVDVSLQLDPSKNLRISDVRRT